ncbi:MAG: hypothetical protein IT481_10210 [Gammaproteobacteria bacterium]|nr:hypothetical protein [Gammaproteobacteria bacterium]
MRRQHGAALLVLLAVLFTVATAAAVAALRPLARPDRTVAAQQRALALARDALRGHALQQHCADPARPLDALLACPEGPAAEGVAAAAGPGVTRGWLPWRTLGLPPLHDASGTCLWMERDGSTARVIAAGPPVAGQLRGAAPGRTLCPGSVDPAQYLDAGDVAVALVLDAAIVAAACP